MHWLFGVLLIVSGLGYLVDGFGELLSPDYSITLAMFTFACEIALMFWLLFRGRRQN